MAQSSSKKKSSPASSRTSSALGSSGDKDATSARQKVAGPDELPDAQEIERCMAPVRTFMVDGRFSRVRSFLQRLASQQPQVLLLEGGSAEERLAAAHYWSLLRNCAHMYPAGTKGSYGTQGQEAPLSRLGPALGPEQSASFAAPADEPCLVCPECIRMVTHLHRDSYFFDGTASSIKIDEVREMRGVLGEPPREAQCRIVIFWEAQALVEAAANALLKSLEEPCPGTSFLMLTPQRERLLPTLVSRSLVLTLPWPEKKDDLNDVEVSWEASLCLFLESGKGWFEKTGARGAVDATLAHSILGVCRRALVARMAALQGGQPGKEGLERVLGRLPAQRLRMMDEVLAESQDSLIAGVNPSLVLEWMGTRLYLLIPR